MAGSVIHLAVADRIIEMLPESNFSNIGLFYLGSIAPDAIHTREGYIREMKRHSHLIDNISNSVFHKPENIAIFHKRVVDFINTNIKQDDPYADLYKGYIVHVLTDELFKPVDNTPDTRSYAEIVAEIEEKDIALAGIYSFKNNISEALEGVVGFEIADYLTEQEMNQGKDYVLNKFFRNPKQAELAIDMDFDDTISTINITTLNIAERLSDGLNFPVVFFR